MKQNNPLTEVQYNWLDNKKNMFYVSTRLEPGDQIMIYGIYNHITSENKRPNGCGSCLRSTLNVVKQAYEKYKQTL